MQEYQVSPLWEEYLSQRACFGRPLLERTIRRYWFLTFENVNIVVSTSRNWARTNKVWPGWIYSGGCTEQGSFPEHGLFGLRQPLKATLSRKEVIALVDSGKMFLSEAALKVPHEGHERHLCELRNNMTQEQYKRLIRDAQYFCQHCGRSAASSENLCFPEKIWYHIMYQIFRWEECSWFLEHSSSPVTSLQSSYHSILTHTLVESQRFPKKNVLCLLDRLLLSDGSCNLSSIESEFLSFLLTEEAFGVTIWRRNHRDKK